MKEYRSQRQSSTPKSIKSITGFACDRVNAVRGTGGYTILEVMIFLAVSSVIFVIAMMTINGQQQKNQFAQSIRDINSKVSDVINDVATGYWPKTDALGCQPTFGGPALQTKITLPNGNTGQGTNTGCTFLGKVMEFGQDPTKRGFDVLTLVGLQRQNGLTGIEDPLVSSLSEAKSVLAIGQNGSKDLTEGFQLEYGLSLSRIYSVTGGTSYDRNAVGFVTTFAPATGGSGANGSSSTDLIALGSGSSFPDDKSSRAQISPDLSPAKIAPGGTVYNPDSVVLCFTDGTYKGAVVIGNSERRTSTELFINNINQVPQAGCP